MIVFLVKFSLTSSLLGTSAGRRNQLREEVAKVRNGKGKYLTQAYEALTDYGVALRRPW